MRPGAGQQGLNGSFDRDLRERFVHDALEARGPFVELAGGWMNLTVAFTEELVGDVQGDQHRQAEHVAGWCGI